MVDTVLSGGWIIDGTRTPPYQADLCIQDGKIVAISPQWEGNCRTRVDVTGKIVSPGFIDIHTHSDTCPFSAVFPESKVAQGITLEIVGNCGVSAVPILPSCQAEQTAYLRKISEIPVPEEAVRDASVQKYAAHVAQTGYPSHLGTLIGQGTLRAGIVGFQDRPLTPSEMEQMKFLLDDQLNQGALGLSLGLIYPPGSFSPTSELRELARVVQKHKKILAVHMRNEGPNIFQAVEEMLSIAEETGVHLHISHLKLMGKAQWGQAPRLLERIEASRQRGAVVTCDQYPYTATSTILAALLPRRAYDGGSAAMLQGVGPRHIPSSGHRRRDGAARRRGRCFSRLHPRKRAGISRKNRLPALCLPGTYPSRNCCPYFGALFRNCVCHLFFHVPRGRPYHHVRHACRHWQ